MATKKQLISTYEIAMCRSAQKQMKIHAYNIWQLKK